jgi:hypothetical protein
MPAQNDEPTVQDKLARQSLVGRLARLVAECRPPQVFGLHGDWGAGKTSLLHQLHYHLAGSCPQSTEECAEQKPPDFARAVTVIWFEAWRYQTEKVPVVALLHEIRTQLSWMKALTNKAGKLFHVAFRALADLGSIGKMIGGLSAEKIEKYGEKWEQEHLATTLPSHVIRQQLDRALQDLLGKGKGKRLVVLVDDLDRCEPEAAYQLLEGIKIYLNLPSCVFVLGMNQGIIERAIAKHLKAEGDEKGRAVVAREYLEKLCQDIWHLPALQEADTDNFVHHCLQDEVQDAAGKRLENALKNLPALRQVIRAARCLPTNPRKIKAFANVLRRYRNSACYEQRIKDGGIAHALACRADRLMVLVACLYVFHPELYRIVEAYPEYIVEVAKWARGQASEHKLLEALERVQAPRKATAAPGTQPEPASPDEVSLVPAFPDPIRGNVFRIQSLLEQIRTAGALAGEQRTGAVSGEEIKDYLFRY